MALGGFGMTLVRVEYEFFDFEDASPAATDLARQVRLHFADGPTVYISWSWEHQQGDSDPPYSLAFGPHSYFTGEASAVVDASRSAFWAGHLGHPVRFEWFGSEFQIVEVTSDRAKTYLFSHGRDRVWLAATPPTPGRFDATA